ncbi:DUF6188 family protein [Paenibacillus sp. JX-17]|uniref:DUF6188 family protein n=1 Tax=Paenibacillus lacisoli TaxID=3064525 RepID=A0ABT9CHQ9_9BACL|nr:DUF6188 family protein [Paenibacillus sp. JX-17]MDO7908811.1 DUF6188 family protein [Paenibacillus sp. JX-17]
MQRNTSNINFVSVIGQKVNEINRMYPILILDDGHLTIECPWRLRKGNRVIVGQPETKIEDKKDKAFLEFEEALVGNTIKDIIHYEDISDLSVAFDGDVYLDLFHDSSWYEGWQLQGPGSFFVVSTPGGGYSHWKED